MYTCPLHCNQTGWRCGSARDAYVCDTYLCPFILGLLSDKESRAAKLRIEVMVPDLDWGAS